ncbi:MAG: tetratricopeptide repeat protein [Treponema sp.]|jgi:tetratricopeptide (TPR) repeat protein|nr:tetratricopeptide repeat protein [Treponema sp.]
MKLDPILTRAARLARRRKYGEAIDTLLPEVVRYHDSFRYHYIMGVCCLYSGDFSGAFDYFKRARDIKMRDPPVLLGLAALFLRRGQTDRALDLYLEVQDLDRNNGTARRALGVIRKYAGEKLSDWVDSGKLPRLYPPLPRAPSWNRVVFPLAGLLAALIAAGGIAARTRNLAADRSQRSGLAFSVLEQEERNNPVETGGSYRYVLTKKQVLDTFAEGRKRFAEGRDEAAKLALNRILESNASGPVKNKARLLLSYTEIPGFDTLRDRYSYQEVKADPPLYRDCYVIWRGMAANVEQLDQGVLLDFLVGYDTRTTLLGKVPVRFEVSVAVDPGRPLEILGRVIPGAGQDGLRLEGVAVHQAASLGNGGQP